MTDGFGAITFWGFTPALDLLDCHYDFCTKLRKKGNNPGDDDLDSVNILLVGAGDLRHILKTLAQSWRHKKRKLNFYVIENSLELYARDMLLLSVILDAPHRLGLQEKTEMYLELYGNLLVRQQSVDFVKKRADELIKMVTDSRYCAQTIPCLDLTRLKYKETDMLEGIAKFWRKADRSAFDAHNHWDMRLRQYLGVRYDAIPNVFDWDYNMKLSERGAEIISSRVYCTWRRTGVAFEIRDGTYNQPNFTLASGIVFKKDGERVARRGYWGDIIVSPYITHGIESEEKRFFKRANNALVDTSIDVSRYNVTALLHELIHKCEYKETVSEAASVPQRPIATLTEITEEEEEEEVQPIAQNSKDTTTKENIDEHYSSIPLDDVKVIFLPLNSVSDLKDKDRYQKLFNIVYFSNSLVHTLNKELSVTFADRAHVILETAKFMLDLKPEQLTEFGKKVVTIAGNAGCKTISDYDGAVDSFIHVVYQPS